MSSRNELQPAAGQPVFLQFQPVDARSSFPYHAAVQYQPMNRVPSSVAYVVTEELQRSSSPPSKRRRRIGSEESEQAAEIVDNITGFCVTPLGDFERKALQGLVKRLRTCPNMVENLVFTLNSKSARTPCVVFPRTLDGRIQIGRQKCFPQETFVRIFRLPDCNRDSLCKVKECTTSDLNFFCVNPYHYEYNADAPTAQKLRRPPRRSVEAIDANNNLGIPFPPPEAGAMSQNESASRKGSGTLYVVTNTLKRTPNAVPPVHMVNLCQQQKFYIGNPYENPYEACQRNLNQNMKFIVSPEPVRPNPDTIEHSVNYVNQKHNWNEDLMTEREWKDYEAFVG